MTSEQETAMYDQPDPSTVPGFTPRERGGRRHAPANVSEPGKTDVPSAPMSLSGQIPTDDEREVLIALKLVFFSKQMEDGYPSTVIRDNEEAADLVLAAGFHRTVQGEPKHTRECIDWCNHCQVCGVNILYGSRCRAHYLNQPQGEPTPVRVQGRQGGKTQAMIESLLAQGNDRGIRVEVVYPQGEPSDASVQAALVAYWGGSEKVARFYGSEQGMRAALRAAAIQGGETR